MSALRAPRTGGFRRTLRAVAARFAGAFRGRSLEAGGGGKRWPWNSLARNPAATTRASAEPAGARAAYYFLNNPLAAAAVETIATSAIGETGPRPAPQHPAAATSANLRRQWARWFARAGLNGEHGGDVLRLAVAGMAVHGESFVALSHDDDAQLRLALLDVEQVDRAKTIDLGGGARIIEGVELDATGRVVAYWVFPDRPSAPFVAQLASERIDASEILHLWRPILPGQVRGVSWLAPVLSRLAEIDSTEDAQLARLRVSALFAGFITDPDGAAEMPGEQRDDGVLKSGLEPGILKSLRPGQSIEFPNMPTVGDGPDFLKAQLRAVAAGMGVTYEQISGDLSGVNYSSIRAGLLEHRRRIGALRRQILEPRALDPLWRRWLALEILEGRLDAPRTPEDAADLHDVEWTWPGWGSVDPVKEADAEISLVAAGLKSQREVIAASGRDPDSVMADIAAEPPPPTPPAKLHAEPEANAA